MGLEARPEELSARARICRAALRSLARHGASGTTIRGVAHEAGVSPGLVQHYFRTKDELVAAVERLAIERVSDALAPLSFDGGPEQVAGSIGDTVTAFCLANPDLIAYARRALLDGSPFGAAVIQVLVGLVDGLVERLRAGALLRPDADPTWVKVLGLLLAAGPFVLQPAVETVIGRPLLSAESMRAWNEFSTDLVIRACFAG